MSLQTQTKPLLSTLLEEFDQTYDDLPATRFTTTKAYHDFANELIEVGISFRVKILKKTKRKPSSIVVMLLRVVDMTKPSELPLEPHDSEMSEIDSVDIIGACPSCGVLMANSEWCAYCGEDTANLYEEENRNVARH
jgi:hypothetical protein